MFYGLALFFLILALIIFSVFLSDERDAEETWYVRLQAVRRVTFITLCIVIPTPLYMEYAGSGLVVGFDREGRVEQTTRTAMLCWSRCTNLDLYTTVTAKVHQITDNPKVRSLSYEVRAEIFDIHRFFDSGLGTKELVKHDAWVNDKAMSEAVQYELYEFNNAKSKELALFYNPLDEQQCQAFEELLRSYLEERGGLEKKGIKMAKLVSFSVE